MGRPPAFCSDHCKVQARKTDMRYCTVCHNQWNVKDHPNSTGAYFCSDVCRDIGGNCVQCHKPSSHRWCTTACFLKDNPGPYPCIVCQRPFKPKDLTKYLDGPPKFCSRNCYERRRDGSVEGMPNSATTSHSIALQEFLRTNPCPTTGPTRGAGRPYTGVNPKRLPPTTTLDVRAQNTIYWWRWWWTNELNDITDELTLNALLADIACNGLFSTKQGGILPAVGLWPWIEDAVQESLELYDPGIFSEMCYLWERVHHSRKAASKPVDFLLQNIRRAQTIMANNANTSADRKFRNEWMAESPNTSVDTTLKVKSRHINAKGEEVVIKYRHSLLSKACENYILNDMDIEADVWMTLSYPDEIKNAVIAAKDEIKLAVVAHYTNHTDDWNFDIENPLDDAPMDRTMTLLS